MARPSIVDWGAIRDDHEIKSMSYSELSEKYGVSRAAISKQAKANGWVKGVSEQLINSKVEAIQTLSRISEQLVNRPVETRVVFEQEVDRRLRLANLISDGIDKSQRLVNKLLDVAETLGTETEDGFKAALIATDNHSKVTQRNAAVIFGTVPESKSGDGNKRYGSIVDKLKAKHARG